MRSLALLTHACTTIAPSPWGSRAKIACNPETGTVFVAYEDTTAIVHVAASGLAPDDPSAFVEIGQFPIETTPHDEDQLVDFTFLSDQQVACLSTRAGEIVLISLEKYQNGDEPTEVIGNVESGILAMAWSPDQDLVIIVTGEKNVLEMTQDFETITEFPMHVEDEGEGVQHSVGWGRKETQFHGSAGKQAALAKVDTSKFTTSEDDDRRPRIAWRGDGSYFTCSDLDPQKDARVIRIYNREGTLQNTSEPVDKLEHVLDWRPSGNLIVSSQRLPHRHNIVFIERNGLRHGEFTLRGVTDDHKLLEVSWNADSTVLAVWLEMRTDSGKSMKTLQLWTSNNYHWYLKQHIVCHDDDINGFQWDAEVPLRLHLTTRSGKYHQYGFAWDVLTSTSLSEQNASYVAVIDGSLIRLTPFLYQNVPPPMCALELAVEGEAQQVAFGPHPAGTQLAVATNDAITFFELPPRGHGATQTLRKLSMADIFTATGADTTLRQMQWIAQDRLAFLQYSPGAETDVLFILSFTSESVTVSASCLIENAGRLYYNAHTQDFLVETAAGALLEVQFDASTDDLRTTSKGSFPEFCPWIATARVGRSEPLTPVTIGLTERSKLYANDRLLSSNCTSFFLRSDWLVFTTTSHTARFIPLDVDFDDFKLSDNEPDAHDESHRRVERGSRIVLAAQGKPSLVLQMPRGNLETIAPRAFVLAQIREDLNNLQYRSAFIACRKNRIDLNILCDENPSLFYANVDKFIEQIPEVDHLNLFLSNLKNMDTTKTLYKSERRQKPEEETQDVDNKVNMICEAFRTLLMGIDRKKYIQSILSTYVKSSPPDLESALQLLAEIRETSVSDAEDALKYTIFLCSAENLYNVALGMYNFTLVLMVAQQAQMDPREYLPFLQELKKLDTHYQRFRIDDHLKRYAKALKNLSQAGDERFDELIVYMQQHALYMVALEQYGNKPEQKKIILNAYGDYLSEANDFAEAALAYKLAEEPAKALNAYRLAERWREAFALAQQLNYDEDAIQNLAADLLEQLKDKRRYQEAGVIAADYAKDIEEAVDCLIKGNHWQEAIRVSYAHQRSDLIETHVKPGLLEGCTQFEEDIDEMVTQFNKQQPRLKELRATKPEQNPDLPPDESLDNIDMFSDTTSMYSQFTRYTQATSRVSTVSSKSSKKSSKLRRREERKRHRGKKGTVFEEEYIVQSLKKLYERANAMQNDVGDLLRALVPFGFTSEAKTIQDKFGSFMEKLGPEVDTIFVPLQLAAGRYVPPEEMDQYKEPVQVEKPKMETVRWKLDLLL